VRERWRKIAAAKKCIVATMIDAHTSESRWRHTSVCARSRRVEESSKACRVRARARFLRTMDMSSLTASHTKTLSVWRRVLGASLEAVNVFSAWIWREKTSSIFSLNFQYVAVYTPFNNLRNQLLLLSIICKKSLFKVFVCSILHGL